MVRSKGAFMMTSGVPDWSTCSSRSVISATATGAGIPSATASSVLMPWIATASGGISTPGLTSQVRRVRWEPSAAVSMIAAVTTRSCSRLMPVVSMSKPTSGPRCQPGAAARLSVIPRLYWPALTKPLFTLARRGHATYTGRSVLSRPPQEPIPGGVMHVGIQEALRQLQQAIHDARVSFDCIALEDLERAHIHAITARTALDAAENAIRTALDEQQRPEASTDDSSLS